MGWFTKALGAVTGLAGSVAGMIPVVGDYIEKPLNYISGAIGEHESVKNQNKQAALNRQAALDQVELQNKAALEQQDKQNQFNLEQWQRENEYNTPAAQRQRLQAAGMNPNLTDMEGNLSAPAPVSAGADLQSGTEGLQAAAAMDNQYINGILASAQLRRMDAETQKIQSETRGRDIENKYLDEIKAGEIKLQNVEYRFKVEQTRLTRKQANAIKHEVDKTDAITANLQQQTENLREELEEIKSRTALTDAQTELVNEQKQTQEFETAIRKIESQFTVRKIQSALANDAAYRKLSAAQQAQCQAFTKLLGEQYVEQVLKNGSEALTFKFNEATYNFRFAQAFAGAANAVVQYDFARTYGDLEHQANITNIALGAIAGIAGRAAAPVKDVAPASPSPVQFGSYSTTLP